MNEQEKLLESNGLEYYRNGLVAEKRGEYNTSVTLFFKAIASLCDLQILRDKGHFPSNHSERFRILERDYPDLYIKIDGDFLLYQRSYRLRLDKPTSEVLKHDVETLFKKLRINF
ncbi:MAG: hypothetical protein Q8P57_01080 [Candidatus Pacearchaeota archaeon]|nr:hypothetical protein [Candidatus Pacearchaeota archaeon]